MEKLEYLNRPIRLSDWNHLVELFNTVVDTLEERAKNIEQYSITRSIKMEEDFFKIGGTIPYTANHMIINNKDFEDVTNQYILTLGEYKGIASLLGEGKAVALSVTITEDKQETNTVNVKTIDSSTINHPEEKTSLKGKKTTKQPSVSKSKKKKK